MTDWRFERKAFKQDQNSQPREEDLRPTFVADVTQINGQNQLPSKLFTSSNKALNKLLMAAVIYAERQGRAYIHLALNRSDKNTYGVADLVVVDEIVQRPRTRNQNINDAKDILMG